jgi:hypothetical protein
LARHLSALFVLVDASGAVRRATVRGGGGMKQFWPGPLTTQVLLVGFTIGFVVAVTLTSVCR